MGKRVVVGAGAVGSYTCGHMARNGVDVTFIDPWQEHVDAMNSKGLDLRGVTEAESCTVPVKAMHTDDVPKLADQAPVDIAVVSTKSYDTEWATELIKPYLAPDGFVLSLQNYINEERIAAIVGEERTLGCIASTISVELKAPALVQRNVPLRGDTYTVFRCGEMTGPITDRVNALVEWLRYADSAKATDNLMGERWSKLVINSSHNGLSACSGYGGNQMATIEKARRLSIRLAAETIRVAQALGVTLEKIKGFDPNTWVAAADGDARALDQIETATIESVKGRSDESRPSMGQDIAKGRRTEIEYLNGLVVEKGRQVGIPTPANEGIVAAVKRVESGETPQSPSNIDGI